MLEFYMQPYTLIVSFAIAIFLIIYIIGLVGILIQLFNKGKDILYKKSKLKGELKNVTKENEKSRTKQ